MDLRLLVSRSATRDTPHNVGRAVRPRRGRRGATIALGIAVVLVAATAGAATTASADALDAVTIVASPYEPVALAFYADARGFFRQYGIQANVKVFEPGPAIAATLASGEATFAASDIGGFLNGKTRGAPLKLVAGSGLYTPTAPTAALVAAAGKRVVAARDLAGKRIGVDRVGSIAYVALLKWLQRGGVRAEDVQLVFYPFPDMIGPLARGDLDAGVLPEPWLTQAKQQGATLAARIFGAVCSDACLMTLWMARSDVDPSLAARFRNAIQAAAVWADQTQNIPAIDAILSQKTKLPPNVIRDMAHSKFATRLRLHRAEPWLAVYKEFGLIPATFTAPDLVK